MSSSYKTYSVTNYQQLPIAFNLVLVKSRVTLMSSNNVLVEVIELLNSMIVCIASLS